MWMSGGNRDNKWISVECVGCDDVTGVIVIVFMLEWDDGGRDVDDVWVLDEECVIWDEWLVVGCDGWSNSSVVVVA